MPTFAFKLTTTSLFTLLLAGPALADSPTEPAPTVDAFGLPCEVTFSPRSTTAHATKKGKKVRGKPAPAAPRAMAMTTGGRGGEFGLDRIDRGPSYSPKGDGETRMAAATVTPAMVGMVVREHAGELELCLTRLPRDARAATVGLVLTLEPDGTASSVHVTGAPKASAFTSCLAAQARTWAYPHADAAVQIEYPITVNGR
jgi:hypothetical protein